LVRPDSDISMLPEGDIDILDGDIVDPEDVKEAVKDCNNVFHLAGLFKEWVPEQRLFFDVNVGGTVNVLEAAKLYNTEKVVCVGSATTCGQRLGETGDETTVHRGWFFTNYERSKWEAEQMVVEAAQAGVPVTMICPSLIFGPGDLAHSGPRIADALNRTVTASIRSPAGYVYIDDVIDGLLAAEVRGKPGEKYILNGVNTTRLEFLKTAAEIAGVKATISDAAPWQYRVLVGIDTVKRIFTRGKPVLTKEALQATLHGACYDSSKASNELGLKFTSLESGLDETIEWLYQEGLIELPEDVLPNGEEEDEEIDQEGPKGQNSGDNGE
tara:strand:+ start:304 stop:1284 length:981 start_codon:yes stop_codon:yes gene_type:complete